jgi:hypothetical protein
MPINLLRCSPLHGHDCCSASTNTSKGAMRKQRDGHVSRTWISARPQMCCMHCRDIAWLAADPALVPKLRALHASITHSSPRSPTNKPSSQPRVTSSSLSRKGQEGVPLAVCSAKAGFARFLSCSVGTGGYDAPMSKPATDAGCKGKLAR